MVVPRDSVAELLMVPPVDARYPEFAQLGKHLELLESCDAGFDDTQGMQVDQLLHSASYLDADDPICRLG
jgi:hypothetical protein